MATTTNYGWTTPNDTDLVKDGAAAIRTLGSSVDTTTKALNPSTTLGDIEYRSATANTNTRLGIGSTGNVLTVAGGVPTWAAPGGAVANWSLLNAGGTALTAASTITISGISGQSQIMVLIDGASAGSDSQIMMRFNGDTGNNYFANGMQFIAGTSYTPTFLGSYSNNESLIRLGRLSSNAASIFNGGLYMSGCNATGSKVFQHQGTGDTSGGNSQEGRIAYGQWNNAATLTSISIISATGNFDAGTIFVYGSAV